MTTPSSSWLDLVQSVHDQVSVQTRHLISLQEEVVQLKQSLSSVASVVHENLNPDKDVINQQEPNDKTDNISGPHSTIPSKSVSASTITVAAPPTVESSGFCSVNESDHYVLTLFMIIMTLIIAAVLFMLLLLHFRVWRVVKETNSWMQTYLFTFGPKHGRSTPISYSPSVPT